STHTTPSGRRTIRCRLSFSQLGKSQRTPLAHGPGITAIRLSASEYKPSRATEPSGVTTRPAIRCPSDDQDAGVNIVPGSNPTTGSPGPAGELVFVGSMKRQLLSPKAMRSPLGDQMGKPPFPLFCVIGRRPLPSAAIIHTSDAPERSEAHARVAPS